MGQFKLEAVKRRSRYYLRIGSNNVKIYSPVKPSLLLVSVRLAHQCRYKHEDVDAQRLTVPSNHVAQFDAIQCGLRDSLLDVIIRAIVIII